MLAQFTLIPLGTKSDSLSKMLAKAIRPVVESGLDYKVGSMGTTLEGDWYQIMHCINRCRKTLLRECARVEISIFIDDRKKAKKQIVSKVKSLERKMRFKLKK